MVLTDCREAGISNIPGWWVMIVDVVVAHPHSGVRSQLGALLRLDENIRMVAETGKWSETAEAVGRSNPDVLVIDDELDGSTGPEIARRTMDMFPHTRVVIVSEHEEGAYIWEAVKAGIGGYISHLDAVRELAPAVKAVAGGHQYLSSSLPEERARAYREQTRDSTDLVDFEH